MGVEDKVVIITGANSGIGAGIAIHFAKIGYKKLVLLARREDKLNEVANKCRREGIEGVRVLILAKDLLKEESAQEAINATMEEFGRLDIVICNAGMSQAHTSIRNKSTAEFRQTLDLNLFAPFFMSRAALPHLEKTKGNILFISSALGTRPMWGMSDYCTSKAGLDHFCRTLASEEVKNGIRANILAPGVIATEFFTNGKNDQESLDKVREEMKSFSPLDRIGEVEEMASLAAFLVSDQNQFMTGSTVVSDGGFSISK